MKILMLVNWKIKYCSKIPVDKQPPDYYVKGMDYWFYRYFREKPEVDVIDIHSLPFLENFEKEKLRFYVIQAFRALPKINQYDLIVSHGMQSGIVISLWRHFVKGKAKHIVFDIGSFASASESGLALKLMQFASKSIDGVIYHTSSQLQYYKRFFPWIVEKSKFIRFGTDANFFNPAKLKPREEYGTYIICVGYNMRDWTTLVKAYQTLNTNLKLRLVGHKDNAFEDVKGVEQLSTVPITELINQIYNAAFCVLPLESFNYSYGQMTLMQQMALGKCVVAALVPSLSDYIKDGITAITYLPQNVDDLSQKLMTCLNDPQRVARIGAEAQSWVNGECNEMTMGLSIEEIFTKNM